MSFQIEKYQLKSLSLFDMLGEEETRLIKQVAARREFRKSQVIMREGTQAKGVYVVRKGKVKLHSVNAEGKESIIYIYRKGEFFGHRPIIANEPVPVTATALENCILTFIPRGAFEEVLEGSPQFAKTLLTSICSEFTVWINKISVFAQYGVKERVAMALLILAQVYHRGNGGRVTITLSRDDLAAYVGSAKETVVRMLRIFKDQGIISSSGTKIVLLKPSVLLDYLHYF